VKLRLPFLAILANVPFAGLTTSKQPASDPLNAIFNTPVACEPTFLTVTDTAVLVP